MPRPFGVGFMEFHDRWTNAGATRVEHKQAEQNITTAHVCRSPLPCFFLSCAGKISCLATAGLNLSMLFIREREREWLADTASGKGSELIFLLSDLNRTHLRRSKKPA